MPRSEGEASSAVLAFFYEEPQLHEAPKFFPMVLSFEGDVSGHVTVT